MCFFRQLCKLVKENLMEIEEEISLISSKVTDASLDEMIERSRKLKNRLSTRITKWFFIFY
jgi:hypothetical protein